MRYIQKLFILFILIGVTNLWSAVAPDGNYTLANNAPTAGITWDNNGSYYSDYFFIRGSCDGIDQSLTHDTSATHSLYLPSYKPGTDYNCSFIIEVNQSNTASFQLAGFSAFEYNLANNYYHIHLTGIKASGGNVTSNSIDSGNLIKNHFNAGIDVNESIDFNLTSFSGVDLTAVWFSFGSVDYSAQSATGMTFDDFIIVNAKAPSSTPTAPADVNISTTGKTTMTLTWSDSATNENGYKIYKSTDGTTYELNASLDGNTSSKNITGLTTDTKYYFIVSPYNSDGETNASVENNTTLANAPTLTLTDINSTNIKLNWNDSSSIETSYKIYKSITSGSGYSLLSTTTSNTIEYNVTGLNESTTYYFKVSVNNSGGEQNSTEQSTTTNAKPTFTAFTNKTLTEDFGTNTTLTITDLTDSNSGDINLSVESNDTTLLSFTKSWGESNLTFANYNGQTLTLTLNSEANKSGVVELNVTAYDGKDYVSNIFNVTITAVNDTPVINTNSTLSIFQRAGAKVSSSYLSSSDPDNNTTLYYTLVTAPTKGNLYFESNSSTIAQNERFTQALINANDINYTNSGTMGSDSFVFKVSDQSGASTSNTTFNITITEVNLPPIFDINVTDINLTEDSSDFNISLINISDTENRDLNITVESNDSTLISFTKNWATLNVTNSSYSGDLNLTISPYTNAFGKAELNVTINDGVNKVTKDFNITISPTSDNPIISTISNLSKDMNFSDFNISIHTYDPDRGEINITVDINDTSLMEYNTTWYDNTNEYNVTYSEYCESNSTFNTISYKDLNLTIKSKVNQEGIVRVTVKVEDNISGQITKTFDLNISAYNFVFADLNAISLTSSTTTNLTLPSSGTINSSTISWSSSNTGVITNSGVVNRGDSDITVTLTASVTLAKTTLTKTFTITVTANPQTTTSTTSSSGGGFTTYTEKTDSSSNTTTSNYEVEVDSELDKDIIDTTTTKTIQTKETILSEGESSQTIIEIPKDDTSTTLKATVEVTKDTTKEQTTLEAEKGVKVLIENDRSVTSTVKTDNMEAKVKVSPNAEAEAKIVVQKKVEVTMKTPKGSEIKQENSGRVTSKVTFQADTTNGVKPVEVEMNAEVDGNLIAIANIADKNGQVSKFSLSLPSNVINGAMEVISSENDANVYTALKSTFKTNSNFVLNRDSKRVIVEGNSIQIIGTSGWQKFEEKQYFNGRRTITLLLGSAKILRDGKEEVMIQNEEYEFIPINELITGVNSLTKIYTNSYLNIQYGWNLITTPIDEELNIVDKFKYTEISYKYSSKWIKNPTTIKQNEGIWIKYSEHVSENIDGDSYELIFNNLSNGWNLLGAGRDIYGYELGSFSEIWAYDSKFKAWVKNPNIIYRGYGFWVK